MCNLWNIWNHVFKVGKVPYIKAKIRDDELYWKIRVLKDKLKCKDWEDFFNKIHNIMEGKLKPLYIDERGMICLVLAFAVWKTVENFTPRDWERLSDMNLLKRFAKDGVEKVLEVLENMDEKEKMELTLRIQKKIDILEKIFHVIGTILDRYV